MWISGLGTKNLYEKTEVKISCYCPFKLMHCFLKSLKLCEVNPISKCVYKLAVKKTTENYLEDEPSWLRLWGRCLKINSRISSRNYSNCIYVQLYILYASPAWVSGAAAKILGRGRGGRPTVCGPSCMPTPWRGRGRGADLPTREAVQAEGASEPCRRYFLD